MNSKIGGTSPGSEGYDQLNVSGDVILEGDLQVQWIDSFVPAYGQIFDIMTWSGTRTGSLSGFAGEMVTSSIAVIPCYSADRLSLMTTGPGDANLDGRVSFADILVLQNNFGHSCKCKQFWVRLLLDGRWEFGLRSITLRLDIDDCNQPQWRTGHAKLPRR